MYKIYPSQSFIRGAKRIGKKNPRLKTTISKKVKNLARNPSDPALRLHKLSGRNNWAISVTRDIRIIFGFKGNKIYLLRIGTHDEVY